jgi:ribonuclease VapC
MLVIDTSALVAIMLNEPGWRALSDRIRDEAPGERVMSAANYVELGTVIAGRRVSAPLGAIAEVRLVLSEADIRIVAADEALAQIALEARIRFGKGFSTSAKLNFGDSMAYALAKSLKAPLLFVGNDFVATDISPAI